MKLPLIAALFLAALIPCADAGQQGPPHRVLAADYQTKRIALLDPSDNILWEHPIKDIHDAWVLPNGNILFQTSWTEILEVTRDNKIVWRYDAASQGGNQGKPVEVHAFQRLENGWTMIAESGPARIIEVDTSGAIQRQVKLQVNKPDPHRDTRIARKLSNGNYLVAHEGDGCVREYDAAGKVVWEHNVKAQIYSAQRLPNGNTLIGCGNASRVIEVDPSGRETWTVEKKELPGIRLAWVTLVERLPNGNTIIVNCHAGPDNPQILEVTAGKKIVWTFKNFTHFGNALPVARVLEP